MVADFSPMDGDGKVMMLFNGSGINEEPGHLALFYWPAILAKCRSAMVSARSAYLLTSAWAKSTQSASTANMLTSASAVAPEKIPKFAFKAF
jgi:hypothetical protein